MKTASLSRDAYQGIIEMIFDGRLQPGDTLNEARLGAALGMSRTPVREALKRIEGDGLAEQRGRFTRVRMPPREEVWEVFFLRLQLEPPAARAAVRLPPERVARMAARVRAVMAAGPRDGSTAHWHVDDDFHAVLAEATGNRSGGRLIAALRRRTRMFDSQQLPERFVRGCEEHLEILAALDAGDAEAAEQVMVRHLEHARDAILHRLARLDGERRRA